MLATDRAGALEEAQMQYDGVKVFSATKAKDREVLGEKVTEWLREHPRLEIVNKEVHQSSDNEFHMLSITLFFRQGSVL
jgi:folate-dependent tRNA-U54 methylase TrmFO/GidA